MIIASRLMGHVAAHAVWGISDAGGCTAMMEVRHSDGGVSLIRLVCNTSEEAQHAAERKIQDMMAVADEFAYAIDAYYRMDGIRYDAVMLYAKTGMSPNSRFGMALPYQWMSRGDFKVFKPKIIEWAHCEDFNRDRCVNEFWAGVDSHEQGSQTWQRHLDQSR